MERVFWLGRAEWVVDARRSWGGGSSAAKELCWFLLLLGVPSPSVGGGDDEGLLWFSVLVIRWFSSSARSRRPRRGVKGGSFG